MKLPAMQFFRRMLREERAQTAVVVAMSLVAFTAVAGLSVEAGHGYYAYQQLVASTNAAALAGAAGMPNTTTATSYVTAYSSAPGGKNASPLLTNVKVTPNFLCLGTVASSLKVACMTSSGGSGGYNALAVTQTADVPLWFGHLLGRSKLTMSATATAAMKGGTNTPWNIAIILDTTKSMANTDNGKQCTGTQISCALKGVQALLGNLSPCGLGQTCNSSAAYVDSVSLYVFPPVSTNDVTFDYCTSNKVGSTSYTYKSGSSPTHGYYVVPTLSTGYTYQVIPFSNDYRTSDTASSLNTGSNIVKAVGYTGTSCSGIQAPGGAGTYYAEVIYTAQAGLIAQQKANPGSQNAMIILSDGNATACATSAYTSGGACSSSSDLQPSSTNSLNGLTTNNKTSYAYPSALGECGQAVLAAQAAANAGTRVFTIGYGAETSGCASDATYSATVTTGGGSWAPGGSPCQALAAMASAAANFYSDNASGCKATIPTNAAITQLTAMFNQISASLTTARLIPNGTT